MSFSGHSARKRFGQHWLKDVAILEKIVEAAELCENDRVLEIGPGRGALTHKLLNSKVSLVHAIELDTDLVVGLRERFFHETRFSLKGGDALKISLLPPDGIEVNKVVANIPYNITSPLLERLIGKLGFFPETRYERLVLLLQKEVADRILAMPGQSSFSAMSVRVQLLCKSRSVCDVSPKCFKPSPKVHSKVVVIEPFAFSERLNVDIEKRVESLLRTAFLGRRKKLRNTLASIRPLNQLESLADQLGISLNQRPQEISPMMWVSLAKRIHDMDKLVGEIQS
ncbi:16S rRNA (adenine(1518)-N(6)/adenine(1519)-N(6))-dimethyltransferase RsmA [Prochlorococcus marinus]|uniref:Ribosomal RNA small subunit methyltransferase A n=1 Tax=Prochlorococcus marinus (strain MIT 9211) TaxID=93059 RepID=RSMA_PROM4|nr:16S rRNA (adenine(1518)-N(6)/adenine(1519)-N(6))-dimethyltransferase RsmA [Prochlorococcus marinus]A9B9Y0.1 RecName: Full=Ribosomal RNA small subunit methyltransferase A; AltName: Full=16S rRNA (adenine(1518)-N(6)/adenine(1519)-N(6))-dimethyltransferase; AltName: Full=16S rRNA dimethyladenosine transferase; AltName: Full=16S rRNA dimethylase; AltName: Full=S-adenosylmethionine-6-N', N'-adenosyl(rRNA) dimethyltransferase [Prochlorococcus marinus str. MIT 9211]ABX08642.1 putative rRNA (adenine-N